MRYLEFCWFKNNIYVESDWYGKLKKFQKNEKGKCFKLESNFFVKAQQYKTPPIIKYTWWNGREQIPSDLNEKIKYN